MNRDAALQASRECFEQPIWALLGALEVTLGGLAAVTHVDLSDARAVGSVLNSALGSAADASGIDQDLLGVAYCRSGQSNKLTGSITLEGEEHTVSFELHLCGPRGGTSKSSHQFSGYDIEGEPTFPGFEIDAPPSLLFFIACFLSGTSVRFEKVFLKFADGIDQSKIELYRGAQQSTVADENVGPTEGPEGAKLTVKKVEGEKEEDGSEAYQWRDAAPGSKEA